MSTDCSGSVNPSPITLGDLRAITAALPDSTPLVIETAEDDFIDTYQRVALGVLVRAYANGAITVNLTDTPGDLAA